MRYLITFSYDGTLYNGYQIQDDQPTIQNEIEKNLSKIFNSDIKIHASGRTDAKVHAINQKAHFDSEKIIDLDRLKNSLNKMLKEDIFIKDIKEVDSDFHARFNVVSKEYHYLINVGEYDPFKRNYVYQYNKELDIDKMKEAAKYFIGTHNFKSFTKTDINRNDYVRTIYNIDIVKEKDLITIKFCGNGFLRYMVRNIVGLLIEVGENKINIDSINEILEKEDRTFASKTANPEGLYLYDVKY